MKEELLDVTKKSGIVFIGKIIGVVFGLIFNILAARFMGANIYGSFMYVYTVISFFPLIVKMGLDQGLISFIPKVNQNKKKNLITFSLFLTFFLAIICSVIIVFSSDFIADNILSNVQLSSLIRLVAPLIIFLTFIELAKGVFRSISKVNHFVIAKSIMIPFFKLLSVSVAYVFGYKLFGLVGAFYISLLVSSIYLLNVIRKLNLITLLNLKYSSDYKQLILFSFPLLLTGILGYLINRTDTFMIGYFLSEDKVGIYNIALKVGRMSSFILTSFNTIFASTISTLYHKGNMKRLTKMYKVITKWVVGANLVFFSIILLFNEQIMRLFGTEFMMGGFALILISIGQLVNAGVGSAGYINIMTGYPEYEFYLNSLTASVNIVMNYFLIPRFGIEGAALASLVSIALANILRLALVYKNYNIHPYNISYLRLVFIIFSSCFFVNGLDVVINLHWFLELIVLSTVFIGLVSILYYYLGLSTEDQIIIDSILKKVRET
ncbi:flippase [Halanaerobacter jeridensis]|uniref:O-antigen/teichoic acid export membrane protein n=1 Tax=Halanaerobacter jeridensis TaxID=706427 RepID=A0A939BR20_9FIRM|nr:flippase [Halanaerobacter jeridensis]MBM7556929.1 O-antigen/teichoic acid export membrane protein [Halanaerobacter jeridensis]